MAKAGSEENPYGVDNDPLRGGGSKSARAETESGQLKRKQKKSIEDAFNPEDPIGNAVRSLWKRYADNDVWEVPVLCSFERGNRLPPLTGTPSGTDAL